MEFLTISHIYPKTEPIAELLTGLFTETADKFYDHVNELPVETLVVILDFAQIYEVELKKFCKQYKCCLYLRDNSEENRIRAYEAGVAEIIDPTMGQSEIQARVKKLVKEALLSEHGIIIEGPFHINKQLKTAYYEKNSLHLSLTEFNILTTLLENFDLLISKELVIEKSLPGTVATSFNGHLSNLKKKIAHTNLVITTVRGHGIKARFS